MKNTFTRRKFLVSTSALALTSQLPAAETNTEKSASHLTKLAVEGGEKTVKKSPAKVRRFGEPERERVNALLEQDSLFYWKGPQTRLLTERFQKAYPLKYVMPCSSGTAALHIAVAAAGIAPGDEVITTPITDLGTVIGVLFQQAVPVFADLEANTANLDPADVEKKITSKTKAIIAVHLTGIPAKLKELKAIAQKYKLVLIEDCAQAWGAKYQGQPVGLTGDIACFSLQNSKHITSGDGGMVASNNERFGPALQKFGDKGMNRLNGQFEVFATNYRMSEPQAAFAAGQLTRLESIAGKREKLGRILTEEISGIAGLATPAVPAEDFATYWFYMFRFQPEKFRCDRQRFVKALAAEGAPASAGYIATPVYGMDVFQKHSFFGGHWPIREMGLTTMDYTKVRCPEAEAILQTCLKITIHENMDEEYIRQVGAAVRKVAKHFAA